MNAAQRVVAASTCFVMGIASSWYGLFSMPHRTRYSETPWFFYGVLLPLALLMAGALTLLSRRVQPPNPHERIVHGAAGGEVIETDEDGKVRRPNTTEIEDNETALRVDENGDVYSVRLEGKWYTEDEAVAVFAEADAASRVERDGIFRAVVDLTREVELMRLRNGKH